MVRPVNFGFNPQTAVDNAFQEPPGDTSKKSIAAGAQEEFDAFVTQLRAAGVEVTVIDDTQEPLKRDAVFPNNWITTHADGTLITYPMISPMRRFERRSDIIEQLQESYLVNRHIALEAWEEERGKMLEGTGALILDRDKRIAFACISKRCSRTAVEEWCSMMDYQPVTFNGTDLLGQPIYHTNVMMAMGEEQIVISPDCVSKNEGPWLLEQLQRTGKEIIRISWEQVKQFAGNMLQLRGKDGLIWAMSTAAYESLTPAQVQILSKNQTQIVHSDLSTIETYGGGSARCMLAEIFLPER